MSITYPYDVKNVPMTGSIINVKLEQEWNSVVIKMRETDVDLLLYNEAEDKYVTVAAGSAMALSSYNFSGGNSADNIKILAASGTAEILGYKRA